MTTTLYEIALQRKEHRLSEHKKRHKEKQEMLAAAGDSLNSQNQRAAYKDKQDTHYPPCDFCDAIPDHHPWHGSGMFKGVDSPHIHACNGCRHLLPTPEVAKLVEALEGFLAIVSDSSGVAGYHLNGEIAHWGEFEEVAMAEEALAIYHQQRGDL